MSAPYTLLPYVPGAEKAVCGEGKSEGSMAEVSSADRGGEMA
jgi:hypothetical protein